MKLVEVKTVHDKKDFLDVHRILYKNDANWICPLDKDINEIFDSELNVAFKTGEAIRWILFSDDGLVLGRIAAFYNTKNFIRDEIKTGGIGFFECVNDVSASTLLFDKCKQWLKKKEIDAMDGPINFGERDKFWGLMVHGFVHPSYQENYNPPFYQKLFEEYGFVRTIEQITSEIEHKDFDYKRFKSLSNRVVSNPDYKFEHYRHNQMEKFANDFVEIYNKAWAHRTDFIPITFERIKTTLISLSPVMIEEAIWFVYAHGEPAGFYVSVLDVNQIFKYLDGKLNWWGKIKFLWYKNFAELNRVRGIVFGIIPKYQNLGIESGLIVSCHDKMLKHKKLNKTELAWVGDFNPKMLRLIHSLGAKTSKIHHTYRLVF